METILITVSVLSTLAIVAIVLSVVVILNKLKGKVDVEVINDVMRECSHIRADLEMETSEINEITNRRISKTEDTLYREIEERYKDINNDIDNINKKIDSRNDKLHDHIGKEVDNLYREINNNQKVLLKD